VPKAPHPGHFPSQRPEVMPHSAHVNWTVTFATLDGRSVTAGDAGMAETEPGTPPDRARIGNTSE
jgi:hypothetical protein